MCGIAGTVGHYDNGRIAMSMAKLIEHRGPDEAPLIATSNSGIFSLAAVRLSIVDTQRGAQPMTGKDGNIVAQNGEIYNHQELRSLLEEDGYKFNTNCDTEVLLAGFSMYGPSFASRLDGIYAISFYDMKSDSLFLFRDYFGVKPLYYRRDGTNLEYASEIKAFWHDSNTFEIDVDYLRFNYVFNWSNPKRTLYKGIEPVLPGTYLKIDKDANITKYSYTHDTKSTEVTTLSEAIVQTRSSLEHAVKSQIPSEVDWAVLLSGGVDSSILAWIANKSNKHIKTFSVCSEEVESDDLVNAREVAEYLGTDHTEIRVSSAEAEACYADYIYSIEDINSRFFFYYFIAKHLSQKGYKVALCGEGADELYMGYPIYRDLTKFTAEAYGRWNEVVDSTGSVRTEIMEILEQLSSDGDSALYSRMIESQLPWFQLNPVDKCSMRFGVEFRVPYLSVTHALPVIDYPIIHKLSGPIEKNILRAAFSETGLPTINRRKYFAGTRTLPSFYQQFDASADSRLHTLKKKYAEASQFLSAKELYTLDLLDVAMRSAINRHKNERKI